MGGRGGGAAGAGVGRGGGAAGAGGTHGSTIADAVAGPRIVAAKSTGLSAEGVARLRALAEAQRQQKKPRLG